VCVCALFERSGCLLPFAAVCRPICCGWIQRLHCLLHGQLRGQRRRWLVPAVRFGPVSRRGRPECVFGMQRRSALFNGGWQCAVAGCWLKAGIGPGSAFVGAHSHLSPLTHAVLLPACSRPFALTAVLLSADAQADLRRLARATAVPARRADSRPARIPCRASSALLGNIRM